MSKKATYVIGLMSGTSLDGVDLVYVSFADANDSAFTIIHAKTYAYEPEWKEKLQKAILCTDEEVLQLDIDYGVLLGDLIVGFIDEFAITNVDFIASHGHTVFHQPEKGYTLQIGNGQQIANSTNIEVICDFRTQDVQLGGQGAPLVPIGDELLFGNYDYCLNLGGFANVSFKENTKRIAFDVCAVNVVLNRYAQKLGHPFDAGGSMAASGIYIKDIDLQLKALPFYKKQAPKSLGLEWVEEAIFPVLETISNAEAVLRTYSDHIIWAISNVLKENTTVLITGGGTHNEYIIEGLKRNSKATIVIPDDKTIEFKEALIFAFLGLLKKEGRVNCLKSVTGAVKDHSSGVVFYPNK